MKIGFDAKRLFCNFRGLGNYSRTLVEGLIKYHPEHDYYLFTPKLEDRRAVAWLNKYKDQVTVVMPEKPLSKAASGLWRSVGVTKKISELDLDIYHGLSHELPFGIDKLRCKSVVTIHDLLYRRYPEYFPSIDRFVYQKKFSYAVKHADQVVAICEQTKRDIVTYLKGKEENIKVHFQSCHPRFLGEVTLAEKKNITEKFNLPEKYILYVGALEERKNVLFLVKAFEQIKDGIEHSLVLVGRGKSYKKELEQFLSAHDLRTRVSILSHVENDDLPGINQMADLFVFPSFFEGWGVPIVESLFSKTPVITSTGSCFSESGGPHSVYVDPYQVDELSSRMKEVLANEAMREKMSTQGRLHANQFSLKSTSHKLIELYQSLCY